MEYYNFRSSNDVVIKSGQEWSYGIYEYQPSDDPKEQLAALVMQIKFDNNKVDCSGQKQDQTGDVSQYFVQWKTTIQSISVQRLRVSSALRLYVGYYHKMVDIKKPLKNKRLFYYAVSFLPLALTSVFQGNGYPLLESRSSYLAK